MVRSASVMLRLVMARVLAGLYTLSRFLRVFLPAFLYTLMPDNSKTSAKRAKDCSYYGGGVEGEVRLCCGCVDWNVLQ